MVGFFERFPIPPNYDQRFADSAACWPVDQVALSLWLRHCCHQSLYFVYCMVCVLYVDFCSNSNYDNSTYTYRDLELGVNDEKVYSDVQNNVVLASEYNKSRR